ncbi:hypothetical protein P691DRAFT_800678 [Macrolepiota fuliginosa MF-IS2]|uniref:F-box domain-containing protein n=1 Tax=Macrolepiota fuliginosa MF-IS2 TaxID=1400762 RepID=A0A9P6C9Q4_9AGAR|nr:hypothetical protein P691DRAFT_800678 [Macrolepiota fuliginosa MF-IS2]
MTTTKLQKDVTRATLPCLPHEIWQLIIRYLPHEARWQVRAVTQMIYGIVMDELFGWMKIMHLGGLETEKNIRFLTAPSIAKRVHHLTIHNQVCLAPALSLKERLQRRFYESYGHWIKRGSHSRRLRCSPQSLLDSIAKLDGLYTVEVVFSSGVWTTVSPEWKPYVIGLGYLRCALRMSGATITRLSLSIPVVALGHFLDGTRRTMGCPDWSPGHAGEIVLPNLEDLILILRQTAEPNLMQDAVKQIYEVSIPEFISKHKMLTTLTIEDIQYAADPAHPSPYLPLAPIFRALSSEPHSATLSQLRSFSITHPVIAWNVTDDTVAAELEALSNFLQRYASQLTTLRLDLQAYFLPLPRSYTLPHPRKWFSNELYSVPFKCLQTLDISMLFYPFANYGDTAVSYSLGQYLRPLLESGLKVLRVRDYIFTSLDQVKTLLNASAAEGNGGLVELDITVRHLSPWLLDLLAGRFPTLEVLGLTFEVFTHEKVPTDGPQSVWEDTESASIPFQKLMESRDYTSDWPKLQLLHLYAYGDYKYSHISRYRAIIGAFPTTVRYRIGGCEIENYEWDWRGDIARSGAVQANNITGHLVQ